MIKKNTHQALVRKNCVVLFVKSPQKGQVKTRISQVIGEKITLYIYKAFVADIIETLQREPQYSTRIAFYPQEARGRVVRWLGKQHTYLPQTGTGLGEKMANTFKQVFSEGFEKALVIGSDIPDLPSSIITNAFELLSTRDAVIGPSSDGGYYLIGFRHNTFLPSVFESIEWGTDTVLLQTLKKFGQTHIVQLLPLWRDMDNLSDIKGLLERSINTPFENSRTISFIKSNERILRYFRY